MEQSYYVGTYSQPSERGGLGGRGKGIYRVKLSLESGKLTLAGVFPAENPSFLAADRQGLRLYAANELTDFEGSPSGAVSAYGVDPATGDLSLWDRRTACGGNTCHVAPSPDGAYLLAANYESGGICVYATGKQGLERLCCVVQHSGRGTDPLRQEGPHTHSCVWSPDGSYLCVADLGLDKLALYRLTGDGALEGAGRFLCPPGSGPRFCAFHPRLDRLYVVCELSSTVLALDLSDAPGEMRLLQTVSTIPQGVENACADLHLSPDGDFLYASNRGDDSIAAFSVGEDGLLSFIERTPSGGLCPRSFAIDKTGRYLIAANQQSDNLTVFSRDPHTGRLRALSQLSLPSPACVCPF